MVAQGGGVIVNVSSQMGHVGSERDRTVYVMTKHALEGLTKAMAVELAPKGVRVVSIAPTFIATPLAQPFLDDPATRKWITDRIPSAASARSRKSRTRSSSSLPPPPVSSPAPPSSPTAAGPRGNVAVAAPQTTPSARIPAVRGAKIEPAEVRTDATEVQVL